MDISKKILAYHLTRLNDRDADIRLKSIEELADLGDPDALEPLENTFKTDPDARVRKAALEAGRSIFLKASRKTK